MGAHFWTYLRLIWSEWASRVTGSLSALLVLLGLGLSLAETVGASIPSSSLIQLGTWLLAAVCGLQATYAVWAGERAARNRAESTLAAHAYGLSFDFFSSLDLSNEFNTLEVRTKIINKFDGALSWSLDLMRITIGDSVFEDREAGPFLLRKGDHIIWFPYKGLSKEKYDALSDESVGFLEYVVRYGTLGEIHDRVIHGVVKLSLFKRDGGRRASLTWIFENETDKLIS